MLHTTLRRFCRSGVIRRHYAELSDENSAIAQSLYSRKQITEETVNEWKIKAICSTLQISLPQPPMALLPGWHQLFCLPTVPTSELSDDGYEADFAPPEPYIARMWGGSKLKWNIDPTTSKPHAIKVGDTLRKTTSVNNVVFKEGKKSGKLLILDLANQYTRVDDGKELLQDNVSMIYRTQPFAAPVNSDGRVHAQSNHKSHNDSLIAQPAENPSKWTRTVRASSVLLFRYSALTFNAHMIHYDQSYSNSEGFQNTLVHGPLQAQLLLDHVNRIFPGRGISSFSYRGK